MDIRNSTKSKVGGYSFICSGDDDELGSILDDKTKLQRIKIVETKETIVMWNGGTTNETKEKAIQDWNRMIRESEDYIDTLDIEKEFNPRDTINKNMDKPCEVSTGEPRNRYRRPEGTEVTK